MSANERILAIDSPIMLFDLLGGIARKDSRKEIFAGLTSDRKHIPSKYFYDPAGSALFEEITRTPEYYLTRTEMSILPAAAGACARLQDVDIVELGSGGWSKISVLLRAVPDGRMRTVKYIPVDVSRTAIEQSARSLLERFDGLAIHGVVADFTAQFSLLPRGRRRLLCFFGSTIGNLSRGAAVRFMADVGRTMRRGDAMLLGVDMVKDRRILERAYNDRGGVTARFNRNILRAVNTIAGTNFEPDRFEHVAFFNEARSRIEMHLRADADMEVSSPHFDDSIRIRRGETIHTENSRKFTEEMIEDLARAGGLGIERRVTDDDAWFSVVLLRGEG